MLKSELIERSPIRIFEKSIHGGLGRGNLGVVTARKGVGKTACLAHIAIDKMLRGKKVLHISFHDDPHHVESWYRLVFDELARTYHLEQASDIFQELIQHRLIIHFRGKSVSFEKIQSSIRNIEGGAHFSPEVIIVDGYDFEHITKATMAGWKQFAVDQDSAIWFAAVMHRENLQLDAQGVPAPVNLFTDFFAVIIMLNPVHDYIDMQLLKDHDSMEPERIRLKLDPKTMLLQNHRV